MSFDAQHRQRFIEVIQPAIENEPFGELNLSAFRVDLAKTGDSILTDIVDGIAHSQIVLADVSTIGRDSKSGLPYRNGNVMYEVGVALACRHSSEVLLVKDDHDKFLFDVSTIPHVTIDFSDSARAQSELRDRLQERLDEQQLMDDARVRLAIANLTFEDLETIRLYRFGGREAIWGRNQKDILNTVVFQHLLSLQIIALNALMEDGGVLYGWTDIGWEVANAVEKMPMIRQMK
jgi:hypothetical protein